MWAEGEGTDPFDRRWESVDVAPGGGAWAVLTRREYPSIVDSPAATLKWRSRRIDPDLGGLVAPRANPEAVRVGQVTGGSRPWPPPQGGSAQDRPVQGGPRQGGSVQDGRPQGGPVQGGPVQDGRPQGGPVQGGPAQGGPAQGGAHQGGPAGGEAGQRWAAPGDDASLWRLPVRSVLSTRLAWHPVRPLVAGLLLDHGRAYAWVADYAARTVRTLRGTRLVTSLTALDRTGSPPLAWCAGDRLAVLAAPAPSSTPTAPSSAAPAPSSTPPASCSAPPVPAGDRTAVCYEAIGPGRVEFWPGREELAAVASGRPAVLDIATGTATPVGGPLLVRSLRSAPDGDALLIEYADGGDPADIDGLNWATGTVRLGPPDGGSRPVTGGPHRGPAAAQAPRADGTCPAPQPVQVPPPPGRSIRLPTGVTTATLTLVPPERTGQGRLLWFRVARHRPAPGPVPANRSRPAAGPPPAPILATASGPAAVLDLPLDWPADATLDHLHGQITRAAAGALAELGPGPVTVGGHSFGATLALYAMAHLPEVAGAVAHSGCYNRSRTPNGFQFEARPYWKVPALYRAFSAFHFADRLDRPVLLVHGSWDDNPSTPVEEAIEFYRALVAAGGHARLVLLPREGHNLRYAESLRTAVEEQRKWLAASIGEGAGS